MENIGYAAFQVIPSLRGVQASMDRELSGIMASAGQKAGVQAGDGVSSGFSSGLSKMAGLAQKAVLATGAAMVAGGAGAAVWGLKLAAANEQAEISFTTMLGSAEKAKSFLDELRQFAAETPFEFPELQTAASSLIAIGIDAEKVIPIMTTLGDVTAGMGTGSEGIKRATVALQQMNAAGRITAEDLNQLSEAGIPVYDLLAAATGKAKTEVANLAQNGKLGRQELEQLMTALESGAGLERFSGLMDAQSKSLSGMISTMKDQAGQGLATAMQPMADLLRDDLLPSLTEWGEDAMPKVADGIGDAVDAGRDFAAWALPLARDIRDDVAPVLADLADIAGGVLPVALGAGKVAIEGTAGAIGVLADVVEPVTGFLADHTDMIVIATGAWLAYQAAVKGTAAWQAAQAGIQGVTASVTYLTGAIESLAATRGVSNLTTGVGVLRSSLSGSISASAGATAGLAAFTAGAMAASYALDRLHASGQRDAGEFLAGLGDVDTSSLDALNGRMADLRAEYARLRDEKDSGDTDYFDDQKLDEQMTVIRQALEAQDAVQHRVSAGLIAFGNETGLTAGQVEVLAKHAGIELPKAFDAAGNASPALMTAWEGLQGAAEITGVTMDEALTIDPETLKANEDAVKAAMSAVQESYASFSDILQLKDEPVDPKQVADARERVADAEARVREARSEGDATRLESARSDLDDARESLSDLLATDSPLNKDKIADFYRDVIAETQDFSADVQAALEDGYDPAFVSRLLQAGPEQAGPILDVLTSDVDQAFVDMVNNAEGAISDLSSYAVEAARLTQNVVNTTGAKGQQMSEDLGTAIIISQTMMREHGQATLDELATAAGTTADEVERIATEFGLDIDNALSDRSVQVQVDFFEAWKAGDVSGPVVLPRLGPSVDPKGNRWGNVHEYALGGFGAGIYAGGPIHKFAEPETGGEFYMPRLGDHARNESMMSYVARDWLGGEYVPAKEAAKRAGGTTARRGRFRSTSVRDVHLHMPQADPRQISDDLLWEVG